MQTSLLRTLFSVAEQVLGLTLIALGSYSYLSIGDCPPDVGECVGWGLLGAVTFLLPGVLITAAGAFTYFWRSAPLVLIQLVLVVVLTSFYFLMGF